MFGRTKTEHTADDETRVEAPSHKDETSTHATDQGTYADPEQSRKDRFGGINWGAGFFGWLVAVAVTLLLAGIITAAGAAAGVDENMLPTGSNTEIGLAAIITLTAVLLVGYYAGGYVAGRMSRYDGGRQGFGVWLIGVLVTVITVAAGTFLGAEYNVLEQVDLPSVPLSTDQMTVGGIVLAGILLLGTLLAALAGGSVGRHYHTRVDRAGY